MFLLTRVLSIKCNGSWGKFKYQFYVLIKAAIPLAVINCVANFILTPEFILLEFWTALSGRQIIIFVYCGDCNTSAEPAAPDVPSAPFPVSSGQTAKGVKGECSAGRGCSSSAGWQCRDRAMEGTGTGASVRPGEQERAADVKGWGPILMGGV